LDYTACHPRLTRYVAPILLIQAPRPIKSVVTRKSLLLYPRLSALIRVIRVQKMLST